MSKLIIKSLKSSSNGKSVIINFEQVSERAWSADSNLSDFQRANGMVAAGGVDVITRYASERVTAEVAANFAEGQVISGFNIQTLRSATAFYVVDGVSQKATKAGDFFDGALVSAEPGEGIPADRKVSMDSHAALYRVVTAGVTVRGADAVAKMRLATATAEQPVQAKSAVAAGDDEDGL